MTATPDNLSFHHAPSPAIGILADTNETAVAQRAASLANALNLPLIDNPAPNFDAILAVTTTRLELRPGDGLCGPIFVDFVTGSLGYARRVPGRNLLVQAVCGRSGSASVIDATAGLAHDAYLLAMAGCRVRAFERSAAIAALVRDAILRAAQDADIASLLAERLHYQHADAHDALTNLPESDRPDVVYLDPMFPPKKKSALVKKQMRILRCVVGDDLDADRLLDIASRVARRRVVVKRMRHAPPLAPDPSYTLVGKTTRYDVYTPTAHNNRNVTPTS